MIIVECKASVQVHATIPYPPKMFSALRAALHKYAQESFVVEDTARLLATLERELFPVFGALRIIYLDPDTGTEIEFPDEHDYVALYVDLASTGAPVPYH